ncbi:MAG: Glycosyltransferase [uncultured Acidimicrobiales bacterium]|uniref:Glycosyltransferase n=1 Tax=uncultured Acidimicrobiales bacterium TaxID=310071 RepID=A0A6J4I9V0_9ACTN|nr:MAG: Glycosyltransferase [uncultured Acidimicrobiales bacterium]
MVVIFPVHNEAATLAAVLRRVPRQAFGRPVVTLVVDDGSTDGSGDIAVAEGAKLTAHDSNRGLGAAVRTGLAEAVSLRAWAAAFLDADGEYDPAELEALLRPVERNEADYVVGSRFDGEIASMLLHRRLGNHVLTVLTSVLARRRLSDAQSGFRVLSARAAASAVIIHDYNYAQVLTLDLLTRGFRYAEVPISYSRRRDGQSFVKLGRYLRLVLPAMVRAARAGQTAAT